MKSDRSLSARRQRGSAHLGLLTMAAALPVTVGVASETYTVGLRRYFVTQTDRRNRKGGLWNAMFGGGDEAAQ